MNDESKLNDINDPEEVIEESSQEIEETEDISDLEALQEDQIPDLDNSDSKASEETEVSDVDDPDKTKDGTKLDLEVSEDEPELEVPEPEPAVEEPELEAEPALEEPALEVLEEEPEFVKEPEVEQPDADDTEKLELADLAPEPLKPEEEPKPVAEPEVLEPGEHPIPEPEVEQEPEPESELARAEVSPEDNLTLHSFLSQSEKDAVENAVRAAEQKTSGEIKVMIVQKHGLGFFDKLALFWYLHFRAFSILLRYGKDARKDFDTRTLLEYFRLGVHKTRDATGVLMMICLDRRWVTVYADESIHKRVADGTWEDPCNTVIEGIKNLERGYGICQGVEKIGDILAPDFPIKPDDTNELSNEVVFKR